MQNYVAVFPKYPDKATGAGDLYPGCDRNDTPGAFLSSRRGGLVTQTG